MDKQPANHRALEHIEQEAARWVLRQDRGFSAAEQDAFSQWLAADPQHGVQLARMRAHWRRLDPLAEWRPGHSARPNPDLLAPSRRRRILRVASRFAVLAAAAAAIALLAVYWSRPESRLDRRTAGTAGQIARPANQRVLPDGSIVELNRGAAIAVHFTPSERRVLLERGEAHFNVLAEPARPFAVSAGGIEVRAVGTAFNVNVSSAAVEVLVTAGRVQLEPLTNPAADLPRSPATPARSLPMLEVRQRAVVSRAPSSAPPHVATLTPREIERVLAWQHRMLDFTRAPLQEVVAEFNRRNEVQLVLADPQLASVPFSATIRSDNVEGFVRLLELGMAVRAERRGTDEIRLHGGR